MKHTGSIFNDWSKIPDRLYHATYKKYLSNIRKNGLLAKGIGFTSYDGQIPVNAVYLTVDNDIAESFAEEADNVPDDVYDSGIVVLAINTSYLDKSLFADDPNIKPDPEVPAYSCIYKGNIPAEAISYNKKPLVSGEPLYQKYANAKPLAVLPLSNWGGIAILDRCEKDGRNGYIAAFHWGDGYQNIARHISQHTDSGREYITKSGKRYYIDEFERLS